MRSVPSSSDSSPLRIGARLRATRLAQGITLDQLSTSAGVTKGFLSRIERDTTSPSVTTLVQICQALSLPVGSLFEAPEVQRVSRDDAPRINMGGKSVDEWLITPRAEERVQVIRSTAHANASGGDELYTISCDVEVLHVISGEVTLTLEDREEVLAPGDTLTFPGRAPHTWRAGAEGAEFLWTLIPATWSGAH